jgi:hypothetical protein
MKKPIILFFVVSVLVLLADQRTLAQSQNRAAVPDIQETSRIMNTSKIRVTDLPQTEKIRLISDALKKRNLPVPNGLSPGASLKLSITNATSGSETYLHLFEPHGVNFHTDSASFSGTQFWQDGSLWMVVKPAAPGKYFFDFAIKTTGIGTAQYTVLTGDANTAAAAIPDIVNAGSHLTFLFDFPDTKPKFFILYANLGWSFYQCEITPYK